MAQRPVEGKKFLFFIDSTNVGTTYDFVVCLTSNNYVRAANVIDASSKCGTFKSNGPKDRTIDIAGIVEWSSTGDRISEADLNTLFENDTPFAWRMGTATPIAGDVEYKGTGAILSNLSIEAPEDGFTTFSATIQVNGVPTQTITPTP